MKPALVVALALVPSLFGTVTLNPGASISGTITPGSTLKIDAKLTDSKNFKATLRQPGSKPEDKVGVWSLTNETEEKKDTGLSLRIPDAVVAGTYFVSLRDDQSDVNVPGTVTVQGDAAKLIAVHPATQYPTNNLFTFDLFGDNFSPNVKDNEVWIESGGSDFKLPESQVQCVSEGNTPCKSLRVVGYKAEPYQGTASVFVRVAKGAFTDKHQLLLARTSTVWVLVASAGATLLLLTLVALAVRGGLKGNRSGNRSLNLIQSFLLDPETNSYSLSKFQLFMFSGTFVFGYLYVLLSQLLVQWHFALPDVPPELSGLLGISAGTAVASTGLTAANGSKGAGLQHPTAADLITSGGVVVAERFQLLVWTIIACSGFVLLLLAQDPATLTVFPSFPQGLLYVMGVSAAGYLGGKAVRKPGPVIQNIAVDTTSALPVIIVQGQNLATDASFFIDGKVLPIVPDSQKEDDAPDKLLTSTPQQGGDIGFASELRITLLKASGVDLSVGDHRFRIVNKDGQFADSVITANPPTITKVVPPDRTDLPDGSKMLPQGSASISVLIVGKGLQPGSKVTWKAQGAASPQDAQIEAGSGGSTEQLRVALSPGDAGTGLLTLVTPIGNHAVATVTVMGTLPDPAQAQQAPAQPLLGAPGPAAGAPGAPQAAAEAPKEQIAPQPGANAQPGQANAPAPPQPPNAGAATTANQTAPAPGADGEGAPGGNAPSPGPTGDDAALPPDAEPKP
jgi:hypothetical protein